MVKMVTGSDDIGDFGLRDMWKKSKAISNTIYAFVMIFVAIKGGMTAYEHISQHISGMKAVLANIGGNVKDLYVLAADTAKSVDMTAATIESAIGVVGAAGEAS